MIIDKNFSPLMERVFFGKSFSIEETQALVHSMMDGTLSDLRIASVLTAFQFLNVSPETVLSIIRVLNQANPVSLPKMKFENLVDCGGTANSNVSSVNIMTLASFVAAFAGASVAKFSTRGLFSKSENGEILSSFDIPMAKDIKQVQKDIKKTGIAFLHGISFYPALKELNEIRKTLGFRTIIDIIFPLANPLPLTGQVIGVYQKDMMSLMAHCVKALGRKRALVAYAENGLDEISVSSPTYISKLEFGKITHQVWKPADFGFPKYHQSDLETFHLGLDSKELVLLFKAKQHPAILDAIALQAASILWCAEKCDSINEGILLARHAMSSAKFIKNFQV